MIVIEKPPFQKWLLAILCGFREPMQALSLWVLCELCGLCGKNYSAYNKCNTDTTTIKCTKINSAKSPKNMALAAKDIL
jgi:hypothetical protein